MDKNFKIGNVKLKNPLILAPLAGVDCHAFRLINKQYGAGLVYTAMVPIDGFIELWDTDREKCKKLYLNIQKEEHPISIQVVGSNPEKIAQAAPIISKHCDLIDFNMGCPESPILAMKAGSYFVKHPNMIERNLSPLIENSKVPVTAKIRTGWDKNNLNYLETSKIVEEIGCSAIAIHGRTKKQGYSGQSDWDTIKKIKEKLNIPVIGNGDLNKPGTVKARLESSGCDFVMIGRAAMGNPQIFLRSLYLLDEGTNCEETTEKERLESFFEFLTYFKKYDSMKISFLRQHAMWFTKGLEKARIKRDLLSKAETVEKIVNIMNS